MERIKAINTHNQSDRRIKYVKMLLLFGITAWCAGFLLPAFFPEIIGNNIFYQFLKLCYSKVCHQSKAASFYINDGYMLLCARCSGIYLGAFLVLIPLSFKKSLFQLSLKPLIIFSIPMILDAIAIRSGIYTFSKFNAFITGILFGSIIIIYIFEVLINYFSGTRLAYE